MDKLTIATQVLLKLIETDKTGFDAEGIAGYAWEITDAMQAEADKRINKERPDVLCEVDWRLCPSNEFTHWIQPSDGLAFWYSELNQSVAPSFGFTGSHIVERPHGF